MRRRNFGSVGADDAPDAKGVKETKKTEHGRAAEAESQFRPRVFGHVVRPSSEYSIITNYVSTRAERCKGVVGVKKVVAGMPDGIIFRRVCSYSSATS